MDSGVKAKLTLKWKIFGFLLGFCALLLFILWFFQMVFLDDMYRVIRKHELRKITALVEKEIDNPNLNRLLAQIERENDISVSIVPEYEMPYYGYNTDVVVSGKRQGQEFMTEIKEFTLDDGFVVYLKFHARVAPVDSTVSTLRRQLLIITVSMVILSVLLAVIIAKRISKPIEDINKSASSLAKGDYEVRFNGKGFREIVELSDTLNTAAVELGRVEGFRRELLANVSHDMRTPLTLIYSYAEMMGDFPDEVTYEQVKVIMDETKRLTSLVNDALDISKLENNMESLNKTELNLTKLVSEIIERMGELLKSEGYTFSFNSDKEIIVKADEVKISRAFYNLLLNAVNYSGECREVIVTQTTSNERVRITVTDKGEGIVESELPLIWDRYYKTKKAHKRAVTGTGLGLSIVRKIVELHCGGYGVSSTVGKGSSFWFEIPI